MLVDNQTAIMGFGHLYILNFDARYTGFTVRTFRAGKSTSPSGVRVRKRDAADNERE